MAERPEEVPTPEEAPAVGLSEGEVEIQDASLEADGALRLIVRHVHRGSEDGFAIYLDDPGLGEREIEEIVRQRVRERRELLDLVQKEEEERRKRENKLREKLDRLKGRKFVE